ncbi:adenine methyltransferase [Halobacteriales archaeon QS_1_68_20]|nr:MAG: adenine methyltransferase [Halobacteriales archaeon QS_1_68_20]
MNHTVFPYPGGKASYADWILQHVPEHETYVEPFGGSAGVLFNKPPSDIEIYNDLDGDLVHFFEILRDREEDLRNWLRDTPYSRELWEEWMEDWYVDGWRPDNDIAKAGVFFYLRCASFSGQVSTRSGFSISASRNHAQKYQNRVDRLESFAARIRGQVVLENLDWRDVVEKYDRPETVFYFDPVYPDTTKDHYRLNDMDHGELADRLATVEGDWLVSYGDPIPEPFRRDEWTIVTLETQYDTAAKPTINSREAREHLILPFDPTDRQGFLGPQSRLATFSAKDGQTTAQSSTDADSWGGGFGGE